jgi:uncharacterized membrane protein
MHDWAQIVRERLANLALPDEDATQVFDELAGHLEEAYQSLRNEGLSEQAAIARVLAGVGDWRVLQRKIESSRKKDPSMPSRVTQFWIPAFVTLLLSMICLALIQIFGPNPWIAPVTHGWRFIAPVVLVYIPWLFTLPFIGALGAYLSNRAGGRARAVLSATIFPILPYTIFFIIGLPIAMILDDHVARNITIPMFCIGLCAWVIFPGAALLAGGWPVQHFTSRHSSAGRIATN